MMHKLLIFPLLLILASCSTVRVDVDYDETVDFIHLSKYAWLEKENPVTGDVLVDSNTLMHDRIHKQVELWFETHGYIKGEDAEADFLVNYRVVVENKTSVTEIDPYYDYYPFSWHFGYSRYYHSSFMWSYYPQRYTFEYQRSKLAIDIIDPETKKLVWRGVAFKDINPNSSQERKQQYVERTIKSILAKFPPLKK